MNYIKIINRKRSINGKNNKYVDGDKVGSVRIYLGDELVREESIYVLVEEKEEKLSWWERFLRWIKW